MFDGLHGSLVALDVDGTLLRSDGSVGHRTLAALDQARDAGATLTLATGRDWAAVRDLLATVPAVEYCLCVNGTEVVTRAGDVLHAEELDADVARAAVVALREALPGVAIGVGIGGELVGEPLIGQLLPDGVGDVIEVADVLTALGPAMRDLVVFHPDYRHDVEGLHRLCLAALPVEGLEVAFSGLPMIEIVPPGAGKDAGMAWLANHLAIPNHRVIAFGDGLNDLSMLRWAGTGVAMGHSGEAVVASADEVTASNDDEGIAVWIETRLDGLG
jgi:hydroxymethylpyrimidine pyrophosphatase-like HAD family hydrolase